MKHVKLREIGDLEIWRDPAGRFKIYNAHSLAAICSSEERACAWCEESLKKRAVAALERLLACPDLNLDELEPETVAAIEQGRAAVVAARGGAG